jgi:hypothetical protein
MKKSLTVILVLVLATLLAVAISTNAQAQNWGWKNAPTIDDVMNFLNGTGAYKDAVVEAKICAVSKGASVGFYVFYQGRTKPPGNWAWKKATTPDDVMNFINGTGAYKSPVKEAEICVVGLEYYVFYKK